MHGIPTPRRANLVNGLGKCLNSGDRPGYNNLFSGINLHQWDCDPSVHTMSYSWNSNERHICDGSGYCVTSPGNVNYHLSSPSRCILPPRRERPKVYIC